MMKRHVKLGGGILLFLLITACVVFIIILRTPSSNGIGEITDPDRYYEVLANYEGADFVQHFPAAIPDNVVEPHLFYLPRVFQGGNIFQLRLKLPENELAMEKEKFASSAIYNFSGRSFNVPIPIPSLRAGNETQTQFPESFEIIVLGAEAAGSGDYEWNHGSTCGIAVDESNLEIVYWFEQW